MTSPAQNRKGVPNLLDRLDSIVSASRMTNREDKALEALIYGRRSGHRYNAVKKQGLKAVESASILNPDLTTILASSIKVQCGDVS